MKGLKLLLAGFFAISLQVSAASGTNDTGNDVRVLIDVSGSMKQNDPNNLRQSALQLLVNLLPSGSQAGVWTFGQYVNMAIKLRPVNDAWRQQAIIASQEIASHGLYTNIGGALDNASFDFNYSYFDTSKTPTSVILLTDGMVDISKNTSEDDVERSRILGELLDKYRAAGVIIHTIALSEQADKDLLQRLSSQSGGQFAIAQSADELSRIFLQTLSNIVPSTEVSIENNQFNIDDSINEFTALVFRGVGAEPTQLKTPSGITIDAISSDKNVRWYQGDDYDLVTITEPESGAWQIIANEDDANRVSIVSNLSIALGDIPGNVDEGRITTVNLDVLQQGKIVSDNNFLELLTPSIRVTQLSTGDVYNATLINQTDGRYQFQIPTDSVGSYTLEADVQAPTFDRRTKTQYSVISLFDPDVNFDPESTQLTVLLTPNSPNIELSSVNYDVTLSPAPAGTSNTLDSADGWMWQGHLEQLADYQLSVAVNGLYNDGTAFSKTILNTVISSPGVEPKVIPAPVAKVAPVVATKHDGMFGLSRKELIIAAIGAANLVLIIIAIWVYRRFKSKQEDASEEGAPLMAEPIAAEESEQEESVADDLSMLHAVDIEEDTQTVDVEVPSFDELMNDDFDGEPLDDIDELVDQAAAEFADEDKADLIDEGDGLEETATVAATDVPEFFDDAVEEDAINVMAGEPASNDMDADGDDVDIDDLLDDAALAELDAEGAELASEQANDDELNEQGLLQDELDDSLIEDEEPLADEEPEVEDAGLEDSAVEGTEIEEPAVEEPVVDGVDLEEPAFEDTEFEEPQVKDDPVMTADEPIDGQETLGASTDDNQADELDDELLDNEHDALLDSEFAEHEVSESDLSDMVQDDLSSLEDQLGDLEGIDSTEDDVDLLLDDIDDDLHNEDELPVLDDEVSEEDLEALMSKKDISDTLGADLDDLSFGADEFKPAAVKEKTNDFSALEDTDFDSVLDDMLKADSKQDGDSLDLDELDGLLDDVSIDEDTIDDSLTVDLAEDVVEHVEEPSEALRDIVENDLSLDDLPDLDDDLGDLEGLEDIDGLDDLDSLLDDLEDTPSKKK